MLGEDSNPVQMVLGSCCPGKLIFMFSEVDSKATVFIVSLHCQVFSCDTGKYRSLVPRPWCLWWAWWSLEALMLRFGKSVSWAHCHLPILQACQPVPDESEGLEGWLPWLYPDRLVHDLVSSQVPVKMLLPLLPSGKVQVSFVCWYRRDSSARDSEHTQTHLQGWLH